MPSPKVLIVRFSSIGDIVLTSPVIRCIKRQTGAEIHFLTKTSFSATVRHNPYIDRLWTIDRDLREITAELTLIPFTHLIDLHGNLRTLELKQRLRFSALTHRRRPPRFSTFDKLNFRKFLLTRFGVDLMPAVHIVDRYLSAATPLGIINDGQGLDYFIGGEERVTPPVSGYVAFVIGAAHATKRLEEEQMIALCIRLTVPVILLGGPGERDLGARVAAAAGSHVYNTCGKYSLNGSADLVRQAAVVVTHDTGLMHVAAAFRRPIVSVWGNTVPALGMTPYVAQGPVASIAEVEGLACRPCSKIGYTACPQGHFRCMRDQDIAGIARRALLAVEA